MNPEEVNNIKLKLKKMSYSYQKEPPPKKKTWGSVGGKVVSVLAFYSKGLSSNHTEFFCTVLRKDENKLKKRPCLAPFLTV